MPSSLPRRRCSGWRRNRSAGFLLANELDAPIHLPIPLTEAFCAVLGRYLSDTFMIDLFFPGRSVTFDTSLTPEEVTHRLQQDITPPARPFLDRRTEHFQGTFASGRFQMMRIVKGRNSFNPVIRGQLSQAAGGTRIEAQLQLHPLVIAFLAIFTMIASRLASIAAPEFLAMPAAGLAGGLGTLTLLVLLFAALANLEAGKSLRVLSAVIGTPPVQRR